jgi:Putative prokaryotic signal transducing protein
MAFCPQCGAEFLEGTTDCSDCGVPLIPVRPSKRPVQLDPEDLVEVWRAQGELNAQLTRSLLESGGITSMLAGESLRLTHGFTVDGLALVRILVHPDDVTRACEIIASTEGVNRCPECGFPVQDGDGTCWACGAPIAD